MAYCNERYTNKQTTSLPPNGAWQAHPTFAAVRRAGAPALSVNTNTVTDDNVDEIPAHIPPLFLCFFWLFFGERGVGEVMNCSFPSWAFERPASVSVLCTLYHVPTTINHTMAMMSFAVQTIFLQLFLFFFFCCLLWFHVIFWRSSRSRSQRSATNDWNSFW